MTTILYLILLYLLGLRLHMNVGYFIVWGIAFGVVLYNIIKGIMIGLNEDSEES